MNRSFGRFFQFDTQPRGVNFSEGPLLDFLPPTGRRLLPAEARRAAISFGKARANAAGDQRSGSCSERRCSISARSDCHPLHATIATAAITTPVVHTPVVVGRIGSVRRLSRPGCNLDAADERQADEYRGE